MSSLNKLDSTGEAMCEHALLNRPLSSEYCFSAFAEWKKALGPPPALQAPLHYVEQVPYEQRKLHLLLHLHLTSSAPP